MKSFTSLSWVALLNESVQGGLAKLLVVVLTLHQNDSQLHRFFFLIYGGQGLSIKDFVSTSAYEGAGFLKLADV